MNGLHLKLSQHFVRLQSKLFIATIYNYWYCVVLTLKELICDSNGSRHTHLNCRPKTWNLYMKWVGKLNLKWSGFAGGLVMNIWQISAQYYAQNHQYLTAFWTISILAWPWDDFSNHSVAQHVLQVTFICLDIYVLMYPWAFAADSQT